MGFVLKGLLGAPFAVNVKVPNGYEVDTKTDFLDKIVPEQN